jgi:glycosyltransferase involved in cell wall biosynthesis
MIILFNCTSSLSGGARAYLRNISVLLAERFAAGGKHQLLFLAHQDQRELLGGVPASSVIWITERRPEGFHRIVWERRNLPRIIAEYQIDVLFTPYQVAPHIANVKSVLMIRNMEPFFFRKFKYGIATWVRNKILAVMSVSCLRKASRVIAVSKFAADYLSGLNISRDKTYTIYHGSPSFQFLTDTPSQKIPALGISSDFILTCGSMLPYRRCEDVIQAFNLCLPALPERIILVIAGSGADAGYARMISEMIAASPRPSRILNLGNVPWETMVELYSHCMLCVIATEIEACPNIALEAMAAGCSIIYSNHPPLPEIFNDCALSYFPRDINSLSQQMLRVVDDKSLCEELGNKAFLRAQDFSWSICVEKTYSALTNW